MSPVYMKEKILLPQSIYLVHTVFSLTFWKGKYIRAVRYKLWLMWVKVIFINIHKKSNVCADSFGRYIKWWIYYTMYEKCFYFWFKFMFLRKNGISEKKLKLISPSLPKKKQAPRISKIAQPHLLIWFKIFLAPLPLKRWRQRLCTLHKKLQGRE